MFILFSDIIIQTNEFFIFRDLLNFKTKCTGGQIKAFSFLFYTASDAKVQKVESVNIQSDCKTACKKRTDSSCVFLRSGKVRKVESINTKNDYEKTSKKRKTKLILRGL